MQSVATHSADYNAADVADDTAAYPAAASLPFAARSSLFTFRFPPSSFVLPPSVPSLIPLHSVTIRAICGNAFGRLQNPR
ncbi:MAG: hypothetical protein M9965_12345 [Anaerolineae bacterium]|nr:hypothetical protein [Anaerolineae bacterium]